ncbi:MAG: hypothetical protein ABI846_06890 [Rudaea sp.]
MNKQFERMQSLLPERSEPGSNTWYQNPKALREWLGNLPLANQGLTARQLLGVLREINEVRMDALRRIEALEVLRAPVRDVIERLDAQLQGDTFPMTEGRIAVSDMLLEFERELATGYIAVACDICAPKGAVPFMRSKTVALALTRAIQHQSARLWIAYETHCTPQVGVWQTLHDLFLLAVSLRCDDVAHAGGLPGGVKMSARGAYMQALLHGFAKPYHFIQKENAELRAALPVLASLCTISPGYAPEGSIAVCTDGDAAPPGPVRGRHIALESLWNLDVSALLRAFDGELERRGTDASSVLIPAPGVGKAELSVEMVERLLKTWRGRRERAYPRSAVGDELDVVIGMQAVHFVLAGSLDFDTFHNKARSGDGDEETLGGERHAIYAHAGTSIVPARAQVVDRSIGGYRLRFDRKEEIRARVGEIVALAANHEPSGNWSVGMLRWLRVDEFGTVEVGVETVSRDARAVSVSSLDIRGMPGPPMRGIFAVPAKSDEAGKLDPYVIVPQLFGRDAIAVEVSQLARQEGGRVEKVSGMRMRSNGGLYLAVVLPAHASDVTDAANDAGVARLVEFPQRTVG